MWKYVTRRFREPIERSANHFERNTTNVVNSTSNVSDDEKKRSGPPCRWFTSRRCWDSSRCDKRDTNRKRWNFDQLNRSWIGAITWSGALVFGWYTSQIVHLKVKKHQLNNAKKYTLKNIVNILQSSVGLSNKKVVDKELLETIIPLITPAVHLVSNDRSIRSGGETATSNDSDNLSSSTNSDDMADVLNSIENKLGVAAINRGQHETGLNLLRSAARRLYGPALFNLGVCYENGMGVSEDEIMAMEFYKAGASLLHSAALYNLGVFYGQGRAGLQRNEEVATRLLRLAAVQGEQDAIDALKALRIDIHPPCDGVEPWVHHHNPATVNESPTVPSHLSQLMENISFAQNREAEAGFGIRVI